MKLTNEEVQRIVVRAEDEYERLKDSVHDLYDKNKELLNNNVKLREEKLRLNNNINELEKELEDMATLKTDKYGNTRKITHVDINWLLTKIKELKGVDKE